MDTTDAPQMMEHIHKSVTFTPNDTRWIPCSARFVVTGIHPRAKGALVNSLLWTDAATLPSEGFYPLGLVYELNKGNLKLVAERETDAGLKCCTFGASSLEDRHVACGDYNGKLAIYDLERNDVAVWSANAHRSIVNAVDGLGGPQSSYGAPELVTGGRDGCVRVWDPRVQTPVVRIEPGEGEAPRDCWTVAFGNACSDEDRCLVAGYDNGDVKLYDLRRRSMLWETNVKNGVTGLEFDRNDIEMNKLVATTLESKFRLYDMRTQHPKQGFAHLSEKAHRSTVWLARHLPQNRDLFMTGGGNGGFNLYKYHYPVSRTKKDKDNVLMGVLGTVELLNSRVISSQPIVSFDWSPDREGLCCLSCLDQTVRVYIVTKLGKF